MRILKTTKPISSAYLKSGKDNFAYDMEKKVWLPGRTTPVRRPDLRLVQANGSQRHSPTPQPVAQRPTLYVAKLENEPRREKNRLKR